MRIRDLVQLVTAGMITASLAACSVKSSDLVQIPLALAAPAPAAATQGVTSVTVVDRIAAFRGEIARSVNAENVTFSTQREANLTASATVKALLQQPFTDKILSAAEAAARGEQPTSKVGYREAFEFGRILARGRNGLMNELIEAIAAAPPADPAASGGKPSFDLLLLRYLEAWVRGEFVDRQGRTIGKPEINGGIDNVVIGSMTTVFFEALFDLAFWDLPVFHNGRDEIIRITYVPEAKPDDEPTPQDPTSVSPKYNRIGRPYLYLTAQHAEPTVATMPSPERRAVDKEFTRQDVRIVNFIAGYAGRQSKSLAGLLIEVVSDVELSFVIGADFAIGDSESLSTLIEAVAEVAARRTAEYVTYQVLRGESAAAYTAESASAAAKLRRLSIVLFGVAEPSTAASTQ